MDIPWKKALEGHYAGVLMGKRKIEYVDMSENEIEKLLTEVKNACDEQTYSAIENLIGSYIHLTELVGQKSTSIARLRRMLFGDKTEKNSNILKNFKEAMAEDSLQSEDNTSTNSPDNSVTDKSKKEKNKPKKGHGKKAWDCYEDAHG